MKSKSPANFREDLKRGAKGEFASVASIAVFMTGVQRVELSKLTDQSTPDDFITHTKDGKLFPIDHKTDWQAYRTGNMFFEPISQLRRNDGELFPACNVLDVFHHDYVIKQVASKCVCDTVMGRIISGESSGLPKNREGWGIKDLGHLVGYWVIDAYGKDFAGKEKVLYKYIDMIDVEEGGAIGPDGLAGLRSVHDEFMGEMGIKRYVLYYFNKELLLNHVKENYPKYQARWRVNQGYMTLGYLVPLKALDALVTEHSGLAKRYSWRVE